MLKLHQIKSLKRSPKEIEERIFLALKYHEIEDAVNLERIKKFFSEVRHPMECIEPILELPEFESKEELESFVNLLKDFWNNMPRKEFKGASLLEWEEGRLKMSNVKAQMSN